LVVLFGQTSLKGYVDNQHDVASEGIHLPVDIETNIISTSFPSSLLGHALVEMLLFCVSLGAVSHSRYRVLNFTEGSKQETHDEIDGCTVSGGD
jgi:hypothetical protein